jgi:ABC-type transport system substrate-binding protein
LRNQYFNNFGTRVALYLLAILLSASAFAADPAKILRVVQPATDEGFDPVRSVNYYSGVILDAVGERLMSYDYLARPAKLVPGVTEGMPVVTDNGKNYVFKIRKGVYFHPDPIFKGKKRELTAEDYVFSFKRFMDPKLRSQWKFLFDGKIVGLDDLAKRAEQSGRFDYDAPVDGLRALDRYTLQIKLSAADYNFTYILAMSAMIAIPREAVDAYPDDLGAHPIGTGAYMLKEYQRGRRVVLEAHPYFRGFIWDVEPGPDAADLELVASMKGKQMPQIGRIELNYIEEEQSRFLAFMGGELDLVHRIGGLAERWRDGKELKPELRKLGITRQDTVEPETTYTYFNMRDPVVGGYTPEKTALRRAIIMSYDQDAEINIIRKGLAIQNKMPIPPGVVGYNPNFPAILHYNPQAANLLLDKFGYKRGADGFRTLPDGKPLLIQLASEPSSSSREFDELWRKSLEKIGLQLEVKKGTFAENLKAAKACQLPMWGSAWIADYPDGDNFLQLLYGPNSGQSNNGCYDSPVFNKLYELSHKLPDSPERNYLYELMSRQVEYDGAWRFGVSRIRTDLLQPGILGYRKHPVLHAEWKFMDIDLAARKAAQGAAK